MRFCLFLVIFVGNSIAILDAHEGSMKKSLPTESISNFGLFTLPQFEDNIFVVGKHTNAITVYSISEDKKVKELRIRTKGVWITDIDLRRSRVALLGIDGEVLCYEISEDLKLKLIGYERPRNSSEGYECLGYTHDLEHCLASGANGSVVLFDATSFEIVEKIKLGNPWMMFCCPAASLPFAVVANTEGKLWSLNSQSLDVISELPPTGVPFRDVVLSQDGKILATLSMAHTVVLFRTDSFIPILSIPPEGELFALQMDKQAGRLFVGATHSQIRVYDLNQARRKILFVFYCLKNRPGAFPLIQDLKFSLRRELINYLE